jgi:hypothetical protein
MEAEMYIEVFRWCIDLPYNAKLVFQQWPWFQFSQQCVPTLILGHVVCLVHVKHVTDSHG